MDKKKLPYHGDQVRALGVFKNPGVEKLFRVIYDELLINIRRGNDKLIINDAKLIKDMCVTRRTFYRHKKDLISTGLIEYDPSDNSYMIALERFYPLAMLSDEVRKENSSYERFVEDVENHNLNSLKEMGLVSMSKQEAGEIAKQLAWASKYTDKNTGTPEKSDGAKSDTGVCSKNGTGIIPNLVHTGDKSDTTQCQNDTTCSKNGTEMVTKVIQGGAKSDTGVVPFLIQHIEKILKDYQQLLSCSAIFDTGVDLEIDFIENAIKNLELLCHFWDNHSAIFDTEVVPKVIHSIIKKYNKEKENNEDLRSSLKEGKGNKNIFSLDEENLPGFSEKNKIGLEGIEPLRGINLKEITQRPKHRALKKPFFSSEEVDDILNDFNPSMLTPAKMTVDIFFSLMEDHLDADRPDPLDYDEDDEIPEYELKAEGHWLTEDEFEDIKSRTINELVEAFTSGKYIHKVFYDEGEPEERAFDVKMPEGYDTSLVDYIIADQPTVLGPHDYRYVVVHKDGFFRNVEADDIQPAKKKSKREEADDNKAALKAILSADPENLSKLERVVVCITRAFCKINDDLTVSPMTNAISGKAERMIPTNAIFDKCSRLLKETGLDFGEVLQNACWETVTVDKPLNIRDTMFSASKICRWNKQHGGNGVILK